MGGGVGWWCGGAGVGLGWGGGAGAGALTGGVSGPLAPWCLARLAFAALFGRSRWIAGAAARSVLGAAVVALAQVAGLDLVEG